MKFSKIILISLILIMLTLGAVSASQDIHDNTTSMQDADVIADDDDDDDEGFIEYEEGTGTQNPNIEVEWPDEIQIGNFYPVSFKVPEDMHSSVVLFVNNERADDGQEADSNTPYDVYLDEFGTYKLKFKFYGDDKYMPVVKEKTYKVTDYKFTAEVRDENMTYGQETEVTFDFPFDATGSIAVGGVKYAIGDEDVQLTVPLRNLQMGINTVQATYSGDENYPSKSISFKVNVAAKIVYGKEMPFNNVAFNLTLPADANGNLEVTVDGANKKSARLTKGFAKVGFDNLTLGEHSFMAVYTGSDYACSADGQSVFDVTPDITVNSFKTTHDDNTIEILLPDGQSGTLEVRIYRYLEDDGMAFKEITKSFDVIGGSSVSLSTLDYGYYRYEIRYASNGSYSYSKSVEGYVRDEFEMNITAPQKVLADADDIQIDVEYPAGNLGGSISLYIDGEFYDELECDGLGILSFDIEDGLNVGRHTVAARFNGNDRFSPLEKSAIIESTYVFLDIPEEIVIGVDDEISISTVQNATGYLVVYVDGKEFSRQSVEDGFASVNMSSLPFDVYSVRVAYDNGNYRPISQDCVLNVSYTFKMSDEAISYGNDDFYTINLPAGLSSDRLVVKVDDEVYPVISNGNEIGINVSGLDMGAHVITVSHPGEGDFYPLEIEKTVEVSAKIDVPSQSNFGEDEKISLVLPQDAKGKLVLYRYDESSKSYSQVATLELKLYGNNMIAEIPLSNLGIGDHNLRLSYSGSDYNVTDIFSKVSVDLDVAYDKEIQYGRKSTMTVNVPNASGDIVVYVDEECIDIVKFANGVAKIQIGDIEVGQHDFRLSCGGAYSFDYEGQFVVYPAISVPANVIDGDKSIVVNSGDEPLGSVIVYADGKFYNELDLYGDKETISLSGLAGGNHNLLIVYDSGDELKYNMTSSVNVKKASITAKDMSMSYLDGSKFKVLVKDYKGKAVKKGQSVKFYVDGKLFKTVKTDKKGYASVVLTHAPGAHTVKAVYKATALTKKVTVKQILTLKKVAVKKSAKNVVLTATLKKVKGKYLKAKQITFKFNGKKYKAVTNSKGVAKVTVPSKVLKKLKAGKKVSYQATYVKATVKQTVNVSK